MGWLSSMISSKTTDNCPSSPSSFMLEILWFVFFLQSAIPCSFSLQKKQMLSFFIFSFSSFDISVSFLNFGLSNVFLWKFFSSVFLYAGLWSALYSFLCSFSFFGKVSSLLAKRMVFAFSSTLLKHYCSCGQR